ncbi:collagen alpha-1(I) chain-like [Mustela lutreola]|uniref:collagen alpha-1(I) chain-like n=1 Tax=Mustela lutreola TaxID=9666 RepID=UPI002796EEFA|nr:collagen alpha-1(I) chain-like [Mustela lutreola]
MWGAVPLASAGRPREEAPSEPRGRSGASSVGVAGTEQRGSSERAAGAHRHPQRPGQVAATPPVDQASGAHSYQRRAAWEAGGLSTLPDGGRARRSGGGAARCPAGGRPVCAARAACGRDEDGPPRPERRGRRGRAGSSIVPASAANGAGPSEREVSVAAPRLGTARGPGFARRVTWLPATRHVPGAVGGAPRQGRTTLPAPPTPLAGPGRAAPPTPGRAGGSAGAAALRDRPPPCPARLAEPGPAPRGTLQSAARVPGAACPPGPPSGASGKPAGRLLRAAPGRAAPGASRDESWQGGSGGSAQARTLPPDDCQCLHTPGDGDLTPYHTGPSQDVHRSPRAPPPRAALRFLVLLPNRQKDCSQGLHPSQTGQTKSTFMSGHRGLLAARAQMPPADVTVVFPTFLRSRRAKVAVAPGAPPGPGVERPRVGAGGLRARVGGAVSAIRGERLAAGPGRKLTSRVPLGGQPCPVYKYTLPPGQPTCTPAPRPAAPSQQKEDSRRPSAPGPAVTPGEDGKVMEPVAAELLEATCPCLASESQKAECVPSLSAASGSPGDAPPGESFEALQSSSDLKTGVHLLSEEEDQHDPDSVEGGGVSEPAPLDARSLSGVETAGAWLAQSCVGLRPHQSVHSRTGRVQDACPCRERGDAAMQDAFADSPWKKGSPGRVGLPVPAPGGEGPVNAPECLPLTAQHADRVSTLLGLGVP